MVVIPLINDLFSSLILFILVIPKLFDFFMVAHFLIRRDYFFVFNLVILGLMMFFINLLSI